MYIPGQLGYIVRLCLSDGYFGIEKVLGINKFIHQSEYSEGENGV